MATPQKGKAGSRNNPVQLNTLVNVKPSPELQEIKFVGRTDASLQEIVDENTIGTLKLDVKLLDDESEVKSGSSEEEDAAEEKEDQ